MHGHIKIGIGDLLLEKVLMTVLLLSVVASNPLSHDWVVFE